MIREEVRGYGRSYKRGFACATSDLIVTLDGDHSYPVDALSYLLEAFLHLDVDFLNASRFPVRDPAAMSFKHKFGNLMLSLAMSLLFFRWVRDSQSGMWVFRRSILKDMKLESDGMAFSEEIKIEALRNAGIRFGEISIQYSSRLGEIKLNPWRDGFQNLWFLVKKRFLGQEAMENASRPIDRSVVVPVWNGRELLEALLGSLRAQTHPIAEILVIDNGSTDGARGGRRAGRRARDPHGRQYGLRPRRESRHRRMPHRLAGDREQRCRSWRPIGWRSWPPRSTMTDAWFATGKILQASDRAATGRHLRRPVPRRLRLARGQRPARRPGVLLRRAHRIFLLDTAALFRARAVSPRRAARRDASNPIWKMSISVCAARSPGSNGWYVPEAVAWHHGSATLGRWHPQTVRRIARNQVLPGGQTLSRPSDPALRLAVLVAQGLWGLVALRHGAGWAWLCGKCRPAISRAHDTSGKIVHVDCSAILEQSEREILRHSVQTGFDFYWRRTFCSPAVGQRDTCPESASLSSRTTPGEDIGACLDAALADRRPTWSWSTMPRTMKLDLPKTGARRVPHRQRGQSRLRRGRQSGLPGAGYALRSAAESRLRPADRPGTAPRPAATVPERRARAAHFSMRPAGRRSDSCSAGFPTPKALILEALLLNRLWPRNPVNWQFRCLALTSPMRSRWSNPLAHFL